jgi:hypothetical protein
MTELAQFPGAAELREPPEVSDSVEPTVRTEPNRRGPRWFTAREVLRVLGWPTCGVAVVLAIAWFIFRSPGASGSKAEWVFAAVVFVAALVSMWQTHHIHRQAKREAAEAAERLRNELAAAEARSARHLALLQSLHRAEMEAQQERARVEIDAQRELARVERGHQLAQQQKLATIGVSRAVSAHTHALAVLWNQGATILRMEDREAREQAMNPVFEQIGQVVNDFSVELANAHLLTEDDRLHRALVRVNEAVVMALRVAEDVHLAVVDGRELHPNPIPSAQRLMHEKAADARHLAWDLLRNGLEDGAPSG